MINRRSPVPVYFQIEQYIEELIDAKGMKEGDRIPSEKAFTDQFHVSRMTVRQAITNLVHKGILVRSQGRGTFVSGRRKLEKPLNILNGFTQDTIGRGLKPTSKILGFRQIKAPEKVAGKLLLKGDDEVVEVRRVRFADACPVALETTYVPSVLFPGFTVAQADRSLYDYVEKTCGKTIDYADQTVEAAQVTTGEARVLDVPRRSPVLLIERVSTLIDGIPFELTRSLYRADRYKFVVHLPRK
ncbi:GntR family transcriptional regulator [Sporolactobacillus vineae]|uniref:GntR family transcriptional regulator n=1 Tax=Sporolactobacillus vineae TaxID=444463 RepID=UPI0002898DBF|nr:GntR family transcriptional regulator [Sporolactobacillus vineae]